MGYQRGKSTQTPAGVLTVEQARRRNAELRLELGALTAENTALEARVGVMRQEVSTARRKLSRQIRDLAAIRAQVSNIAALAQHAPGEEPVFGGREGLEAATAEARAHDEETVNPSTRRRRKGPSHGTSGRYREGCRCEDCRGWRCRKSERERALVKLRREQEIAQALKAHGVEEVAA